VRAAIPATRRLLDWWNAYWFPVSSSLNLAAARIVAVAFAMMVTFPSLGNNINLAVKNSAFSDPQILVRAIAAVIPRHVLFTARGLTLVYAISMIAGVMALVGLFTRTALFVFALGLAFFVSHVYSYADVHHREAPMAFFLFALALAPSGDSLSLDVLRRRRRARREGRPADMSPQIDTAMWPLKFIHVVLAMTYFSTGITKVISGGLRWMNGYTLQKYIFITAINRDLPLGLWLSHQHTLCMLLGAATLAFELFYFLSLPFPRLAPMFFVGGIVFHVSLYLTAGHPFFEHILLNAILLLFLDRNWFPAQIRRLRASLTRRDEPRPAGAVF
jgi:vitamin K-dependent gamma-carboxylase-like protein